MKKALFTLVLSLFLFASQVLAQVDTLQKMEASKVKIKEDKPLRFNLNEDGSHFFQANFLNQTWVRFNQSNPGTIVLGQPKDNTFDIGLRRTRIQLYGQITDRTFLYFQFGQNNFNAFWAGQGSNNRIVSAYFHDALCEFRVSKKNQLKFGGGLTIANGLSRFSNPSVGTIMTLDVPVFAQATVNAIDQFSRKLSVYARGQVGKIDYRLVLSDPFPAGANYSGSAAFTALSKNNTANFSAKKHNAQYQAYVMYQFFEHEAHTTPYMTGTYLGKKKVFNIAGGVIYQPNAMWKRRGSAIGDTTYQDMILWAVESFLDMPLNIEKGTAISAYAGYFNTNYGTDYVRTQAQMNPATGVVLPGDSPYAGSVSGSGNGWPMFGTGQVIYSQVGYLFKRDLLGDLGTLMPYLSYQRNMFNVLKDPVNVYDVGVNWLISGHKSKISIDYQNRPVYKTDNTVGKRASCAILQYQIYI